MYVHSNRLLHFHRFHQKSGFLNRAGCSFPSSSSSSSSAYAEPPGLVTPRVRHSTKGKKSLSADQDAPQAWQRGYKKRTRCSKSNRSKAHSNHVLGWTMDDRMANADRQQLARLARLGLFSFLIGFATCFDSLSSYCNLGYIYTYMLH